MWTFYICLGRWLLLVVFLSLLRPPRLFNHQSTSTSSSSKPLEGNFSNLQPETDPAIRMDPTTQTGVTFVDEESVESVISWQLVNEAVEESFRSVSNVDNLPSHPHSNQPARNLTKVSDHAGLMFTMPGYIGNYTLGERKYSTLACKLVTCFTENEKKNLPSIMANILLMDATTGKLKCVMEGTTITAWRTAAASLVATKHLYFARQSIKESDGKILAIVGCGVQGRIHAIGMCSTFNIAEVRLWNRTKSKADNLLSTLNEIKTKFINKNVNISVTPTVEDCLHGADIVVTSTNALEPLIHWSMLKGNVHINAVGAGVSHHSELSPEVYTKCKLFIDSWAGANSELVGLKPYIIGEVGEVINNGNKSVPQEGVSVFQSLGMAVEDAAVAQAIFEKLKN